MTAILKQFKPCANFTSHFTTNIFRASVREDPQQCSAFGYERHRDIILSIPEHSSNNDISSSRNIWWFHLHHYHKVDSYSADRETACFDGTHTFLQCSVNPILGCSRQSHSYVSLRNARTSLPTIIFTPNYDAVKSLHKLGGLEQCSAYTGLGLCSHI
jgi:hypothetical protein